MTKRYVWLAAAAVLGLGACQADAPATDPAADTAGIADTTPNADTPVAPADSASDAGMLTANGWGPLRIGMTRDEVVAAAGPDANPDAVGGPDPEQCDQFRPERAPEGMLVMVLQGRLARITMSRNDAVRTDRGLGVGDSASAIMAAYGSDATRGAHKYQDAPAEYITWWSTEPPASDVDAAPDARGIVYEIGQDGRVMHVHAGGPSIRYVEGCL